ncbi:MAG TPA: hypothetical protein VFZ59_21855 [Verrucomicrobiae bacterium]|nr:hypothetical protein [Verrucomicrobiae bacterium]
MTALALRKKRLLAESEVNREQLVIEYRSLNGEVRELKSRFHGVCSAVTSAASVGMAGVKAIGEVRETYSRDKGSWLAAVLTGMRAGTSIWRSIRSRH